VPKAGATIIIADVDGTPVRVRIDTARYNSSEIAGLGTWAVRATEVARKRAGPQRAPHRS
jgi:hypothetical protein